MARPKGQGRSTGPDGREDNGQRARARGKGQVRQGQKSLEQGARPRQRDGSRGDMQRNTIIDNKTGGAEGWRAGRGQRAMPEGQVERAGNGGQTKRHRAGGPGLEGQIENPKSTWPEGRRAVTSYTVIGNKAGAGGLGGPAVDRRPGQRARARGLGLVTRPIGPRPEGQGQRARSRGPCRKFEEHLAGEPEGRGQMARTKGPGTKYRAVGAGRQWPAGQG